MANLIELQDGDADYMGDGVFLVRQHDERGQVQSVGLSEGDLRAMLAAIPGSE